MTNFIPVFPLNIVVYPTEPLNLHVFEPRYIQLINECITEHKSFGIPVVIDSKVQEYGTRMEVLEVAKKYDNGEMDIRVKGSDIFRVLELVKEVPEKMYSGAIVNYPDNSLKQDESKLEQLVLKEVKRMYALLNVEEKLPDITTGIVSYTIAHYVGMELEQEYELLKLFNESQRLEYIRKHMNKMVPVLEGLEKAKARIKLNGHFRDLSLDDLDM